jgi:hypothetical protein
MPARPLPTSYPLTPTYPGGRNVRAGRINRSSLPARSHIPFRYPLNTVGSGSGAGASNRNGIWGFLRHLHPDAGIIPYPTSVSHLRLCAWNCERAVTAAGLSSRAQRGIPAETVPPTDHLYGRLSYGGFLTQANYAWFGMTTIGPSLPQLPNAYLSLRGGRILSVRCAAPTGAISPLLTDLTAPSFSAMPPVSTAPVCERRKRPPLDASAAAP